jgi:MYXO-CTERM domain-containing protein
MPLRSLSAFFVAVVLLPGDSVSAQEPLVAPFLQLATPESVAVTWELDFESEGKVEWGETEALGSETTATARTIGGDGLLYEAEIVGLEPDTVYYYRASADWWASDIQQFRTPTPSSDDGGLRLVAMSDMQRNETDVDSFVDIVENGVLAWTNETFGLPVWDALDLVLIPGDLVSDGTVHEHWTRGFFRPVRALIRHVPVYPVPGNHEKNAQFFFDYFRLPDNGSTNWPEHWWTFDQANVRIIGLDTNEAAWTFDQLDWLDAQLEDACGAEHVDFVIAQFHHPVQSELWPVGELGFAREMVTRLEAFSDTCGKPSVHLYGHTHGYARGQSRDHQHLWINVASAGGALDDWGEYAQTDYPETTVSQDEFGFVVIETSAGDAPELVVTRIGRGKPGAVLDNVVRDKVRIRNANAPPERPRPLQPAGAGIHPECATLEVEAAPVDPDGDSIQAAHWQVATDCEAFEDIVAERWVQSENWYHGEDTQAGVSLALAEVESLPAESELCWRVRFRDEGLAWSPWSVAVPLETGASSRSDNLLENGSFGSNLDGWTSDDPVAAIGRDDECQGVYPGAGRTYLAPAGLCEPATEGSVWQIVDLAEHSEAIDEGSSEVFVRALGTTRAGAGSASITLEFLADDGTSSLGESADVLAFDEPRWVRQRATVAIPEGTRFVRVVAAATRSESGDAGFLDDIELRIGGAGVVDCAAQGDGEIPPDPEPEADPDPESDADVSVPADVLDAAGDLGGASDADAVDDVGADATPPSGSDQRDHRGCTVARSGSGWLPNPMVLVALALIGFTRRRR